LKRKLKIIGDVRGSGLFIGIELIRDKKLLTPATEETSFICTKLKEVYAILTSIDGPHENVLVVKPHIVFNKADADRFIFAFDKVISNDLVLVHDIKSTARMPT